MSVESKITDLASRFDREAESTITLRAGDLANIVRQAAAALQRAGAPIYSRGALLYRTAHLDAPDTGPVRRPIGALILRPVDPHWLRLQLAEAAIWQRWDSRAKKHLPAEPPLDLALTLLAASDSHGWPALRGISQVPILTAAGDIISAPGFDADSGLLLNLTGDWPTPPAPDREAAEAAREALETLLRHFPFASSADRAVALSLLVTAVVRGTLATAPLHAVDAPEAGSGKSLLVDAGAILATGRTAAVVEYGRDAIEAGKRLDAALIAGDPFVALDNIDAPLEGAALCQTLTQTSRNIRIMGTNTQATAPCSAFVTATGNNLILRGDVVRRSLVCRLDPETDRPELRRFDQDLLAETLNRRAELVMAALAIVRAYIIAGRPNLGLSPLGSFENWSRTVRAALVWAGTADPCETMTRTRTSDPHRQATVAMFAAWREAFGDDGATAADAIAKAAGRPDLAEALAEVCNAGGTLDSRRLGNWLRAHRDSRAGSLVLRHKGTTNRAVRWAVYGGEAMSLMSLNEFTETQRGQSVREKVTVKGEGVGGHSADSSDSSAEDWRL